ncbi:MAG: hypothetical protein M1828_003286 [Chrysothrix sp. TS-e1954]|nr:MAG: hypothetical protein M1828_003286 [Chrysothrix sp. TS-e1954]
MNAKWRKSSLAGLGKENFIGNPILLDTTFEGGHLDSLSEAQEKRSPTVVAGMNARVRNDEGLGKSRNIPFSTIQNQDWRISNTPESSSVYTESPNISQLHDSESSVRPLFSGRPNQNGAMSAQKVSEKRESGIPVMRKTNGSRIGSGFGKSFADKAAKAGISGLGIVSSARPPWKGASGRHNPMTPITDAPRSAPLPQEDSAVSPLEEHAAQDRTTYLTVRHGKVSPIDADASSTLSRPMSQVSSMSGTTDHDMRPPVPRKTTSGSQETKTLMPRQFSLRGSPWKRSKSRQEKAVSADVTNLLSETPIASTSPGDLEREVLGEPVQQPSSRFSWSTRATESVMPETPSVGTPRERLPVSPPQGETVEPGSRFSWTTAALSPKIDAQSPQSQLDQSPSPPSPIMNRRRPMFGPNTPPSDAVIKRKPVGSRPSIDMDSPASSSVKDLPLSPPEAASVDLVTALEAQLNDLARRRMNLSRIIDSMTALQPQNPVVQDLEKRRKHQQNVDRVEQELAEVKRKEHQLGLRLHRAWKRRDQDAPTALWVRRVTG